jgi:hypothetical protein
MAREPDSGMGHGYLSEERATGESSKGKALKAREFGEQGILAEGQNEWW